MASDGAKEGTQRCFWRTGAKVPNEDFRQLNKTMWLRLVA